MEKPPFNGTCEIAQWPVQPWSWGGGGCNIKCGVKRTFLTRLKRIPPRLAGFCMNKRCLLYEFLPLECRAVIPSDRINSGFTSGRPAPLLPSMSRFFSHRITVPSLTDSLRSLSFIRLSSLSISSHYYYSLCSSFLLEICSELLVCERDEILLQVHYSHKASNSVGTSGCRVIAAILYFGDGRLVIFTHFSSSISKRILTFPNLEK